MANAGLPLKLLIAVLANVLVFGEEECGDGYTCAMESAYCCAPISGGKCVCCSAGQTVDECTTNGTFLPFCPSGGATGSGCIRLADEKRHKHRDEDSADLTEKRAPSGHDKTDMPQKELFEEECGDGYTCTYQRGAYGCVALPGNANQTMVCCSAGQPEKYCAEASTTSKPLPYCPAGGATGGGCVRESVKERLDRKEMKRIRVNDDE